MGMMDGMMAFYYQKLASQQLVNQVGYDTFRISLADLSANINGTALINTATGSSIASSIGTAKLWSLINTTSGGTETWTVGIAN